MIHTQPMSDGGWVATHEDITEQQQAEASIAFLAEHDALTRLANRLLFNDRLDRAIAMAERGDEFALLYLDLDHFKIVNDTLGHPAGDGLLRAAADRLLACVREEDTVARLGGDEFAVIQIAGAQPAPAEIARKPDHYGIPGSFRGRRTSNLGRNQYRHYGGPW